MRRVVVESPFAADTPEGIERNQKYLRACMHDCVMRNESPYASHGLLTQPGVLDDNVPEQRKRGIEAGFAWKDVAHATVVYTDLGISRGMSYGIEAAEKLGQKIEFRSLGESWSASPRAHTP